MSYLKDKLYNKKGYNIYVILGLNKKNKFNQIKEMVDMVFFRHYGYLQDTLMIL